MTPMRQAKTGGVLLGMVVAMVAVGVLSVAMVKSLQGQAVTGGRAYNLMRARYAADSGYAFFSALSLDDKEAYAGLGQQTFVLGNGDQFLLTVSTNATYVIADITGQMLSGNSVSALRPLTARFSRQRAVTPSADELLDLVVSDLVGQGKGKGKGKSKVSEGLIVIEDTGADKGKGKSSLIKWEKTYDKLLALHEGFVLEGLPTASGGTSIKLRTDLDILSAELDTSPATENHMVWSVELPLDFSTEAAVEVDDDGYLSYDAQTKISWQFEGSGENENNRVMGAQGLAFKLHDRIKATGKKEVLGSQFYAVTLMRYEGGLEENNVLGMEDAGDTQNTYIKEYSDLDEGLTGEFWSDGYWGDWSGIPNAIKPVLGSESSVFCGMVLWKQSVDEFGVPERTWVAYQSLAGIGRRVLDTTVHLRTTEGMEDSGSEYIDVQMRLSDSLDTTASDSRFDENREAYLNADDYDPPPGVSPYWAPFDSNDWSTVYDYTTDMKPTLNTAEFSTSQVKMLDDGETIRIYDADYLFKNQDGPLGDIGLVFCGNFLSGIDTSLVKDDGKLEKKVDIEDVDIPSLYMAVDDFAIRWFRVGSDGSSDVGTDIITDF